VCRLPSFALACFATGWLLLTPFIPNHFLQLDATRKKKEMWKIEKQAKEEKERLKLDAAEDALQKKVRDAQIRRANELLYEQTDKMKNLRSQMLYCDVIEEQKFQVQHKEKKREMEFAMEEHWYQQQQQQMDEYDRKEDQELMQRVQKVATTAKMQQDKLELNKAQYIKSLQREKTDGEKLRLKAEGDLRDEQEKEASVRRKARLAVEQLRLENEKLKKVPSLFLFPLTYHILISPSELPPHTNIILTSGCGLKILNVTTQSNAPSSLSVFTPPPPPPPAR
jgi:hypothetical protein